MPKPSWLLVVHSALFISACLVVAGLAMAGFVHWDSCGWFTAVVLGVPSVVFAYLQYAATFRRRGRSAKVLMASLGIVGGLFGLTVVGAIVEPLASGIIPTADYLLFPVLPFTAIATWCVCASFLNARWRKALILAENMQLARTADAALSSAIDDVHPRQALARPWARRDWLALGAGALVLFAAAAYGVRDIPPQRAMHVSPTEAHLTLPEAASDVCIVRGSRGTITYDFAIDEPGFRQWAKSEKGSLESEAAHVPIRLISERFTI